MPHIYFASFCWGAAPVLLIHSFIYSWIMYSEALLQGMGSCFSYKSALGMFCRSNCLIHALVLKYLCWPVYLIYLWMERKQGKEIKTKELFGTDLILNHSSTLFPSVSLPSCIINKGRRLFSPLPIGTEEQQIVISFGDWNFKLHQKFSSGSCNLQLTSAEQSKEYVCLSGHSGSACDDLAPNAIAFQ